MGVGGGLLGGVSRHSPLLPPPPFGAFAVLPSGRHAAALEYKYLGLKIAELVTGAFQRHPPGSAALPTTGRAPVSPAGGDDAWLYQGSSRG